MTRIKAPCERCHEPGIGTTLEGVRLCQRCGDAYYEDLFPIAPPGVQARTLAEVRAAFAREQDARLDERGGLFR